MSLRLLLALVLLLALIAGVLTIANERERRSATDVGPRPVAASSGETPPLADARASSQAAQRAGDAASKGLPEHSASAPEPHAKSETPATAAPVARKHAARVVGRLARRSGADLENLPIQVRDMGLTSSADGFTRVTSLRSETVTRFSQQRTHELGTREPFELSIPDGCFVFHLWTDSSGERRELRISCDLSIPPVAEDVRIPLPRTLPEEVDLGTLWLSPPEELFAGTIVDARGRSIPDVRVSVVPERVHVASERERFLLTRDLTSGPDGRFRIFGASEAPTFQLDFDHSLHDALELMGNAPGSHALRIELKRNEKSSLSGHVQLADAKFLPFVHAVLTRRSDQQRRSTSCHTGDFDFRPLDEGLYDLRFLLEPLGEVVGSTNELHVLPSSECKDPRLATVEIGGNIIDNQMTVLCTYRSGRASPGFLKRITLEREDGTSFEVTTDNDGEVRIPSVHTLPPLNLVASRGRRIPFRNGARIVIDD